MSDLVLHRDTDSQAIALPEPRGGAIGVRVAVPSDLAFVDQLQKMHTKMVGWMPTGQLETYIAKGQVLIAEQSTEERVPSERSTEERVPSTEESACSPSLGTRYSELGTPPGTAVGYCISQDKYLKREELGIVYQLNVLPMKQRGLIGATLIKHVFDRAAYGCKLFCCWCAQDLEANHFWESIGFVPLAFRTGSRKAGQKKEPRIHIFWQRRIREGDTETPYWFPSETTGGAVRENRLVLPIPPGTHWSDAKPAILPGMENVNVVPQLESDKEKKPRSRSVKKDKAARPVMGPKRSGGGLWFGPPPPTAEEIAKAKEEKKKAKEKRPKFKNDPKLIAAARELRDRYTEQINAGLLLPPSACGKYEVSRQLEHAESKLQSAMRIEQVEMPEARLLDAA